MSPTAPRRRLLASVAATALTGCLQGSEPPPGGPPDASFSTAIRASDGDEYLHAVHERGQAVDAGDIRVTVGGELAYADGEIRAAFDAGPETRNEWSDGATSGDRIAVSTGGHLPWARAVVIEARSDGGAFHPVLERETPPPEMELAASAGRVGDTETLRLTHRRGDELPASSVRVDVAGTTVYRDGSVRAGDGRSDATLDEWADGVSPGDSVRFATGSDVAPGDRVAVYWLGAPDESLRTVAETAVPGE